MNQLDRLRDPAQRVEHMDGKAAQFWCRNGTSLRGSVHPRRAGAISPVGSPTSNERRPTYALSGADGGLPRAVWAGSFRVMTASRQVSASRRSARKNRCFLRLLHETASGTPGASKWTQTARKIWPRRRLTQLQRSALAGAR